MPASFGQKLITAREQRGLSIEDAAHETRIPVQRLRLLESGNVAAFGSMTYARSFIRSYSDFLGVDAADVLEELPEGALGGERDYRYLTHSHGPWIRNQAERPERITAPAASRIQSIRSPLPAGIAVFVMILAGTAMWGKHVAEASRQVQPDALKATSVLEDSSDDLAVPVASGVPMVPVAAKPRPVEFPISTRKATRVD